MAKQNNGDNAETTTPASDDLAHINGTDGSLGDAMHDDTAYGSSFLDDTLDDVLELVAYEGEQRLQIVSAKTGRKSPEKAPYLLIRLELPDHLDALSLTHVIGLSDPQIDSPKDMNMKRLRLREFYEAFGVDYTQPVDLDGLAGMEGWGILSTETSPEYGEQMRVRRFITGG